jgi:hypothetical protein
MQRRGAPNPIPRVATNVHLHQPNVPRVHVKGSETTRNIAVEDAVNQVVPPDTTYLTVTREELSTIIYQGVTSVLSSIQTDSQMLSPLVNNFTSAIWVFKRSQNLPGTTPYLSKTEAGHGHDRGQRLANVEGLQQEIKATEILRADGKQGHGFSAKDT